jgi:hypothetical protein
MRKGIRLRGILGSTVSSLSVGDGGAQRNISELCGLMDSELEQCSRPRYADLNTHNYLYSGLAARPREARRSPEIVGAMEGMPRTLGELM